MTKRCEYHGDSLHSSLTLHSSQPTLGEVAYRKISEEVRNRKKDGLAFDTNVLGVDNCEVQACQVRKRRAYAPSQKHNTTQTVCDDEYRFKYDRLGTNVLSRLCPMRN